MHLRIFVAVATLAMMADSVVLAKANITVGSSFPSLRGREMLSGKSFRLQRLKGKVVLIDFWATWCPACVKDLKNKQRVYQEYHDRGLEIVSISLDKNSKRLRDFARKNDMDWYHLWDGKGWKSPMVKMCGIPHIPMAYVLDRNGKVSAKRVRGYNALKTAIEIALNKESSDTISDDETAQAMLAKARSLHKKGEVGPAVALYRRLRKDYSGTDAANKAKAAMKEIAADPKLKAEAQAYLDREDARQTLERARELRKAGHTVLAKKYYRRVYERYADTPEAKTARTEIGQMEG